MVLLLRDPRQHHKSVKVATALPQARTATSQSQVVTALQHSQQQEHSTRTMSLQTMVLLLRDLRYSNFVMMLLVPRAVPKGAGKCQAAATTESTRRSTCSSTSRSH